jgi:hypothetical protein
MKGKRKGSPKTGGRQKGSVNVITRPLKELISSYSQDSFNRFIVEMDRLEGSEYVKAYLSLLEYSLPKLQRSEIMGEVSSLSFTEENNLTGEERRLMINRLRQEIEGERKNENGKL